MPTLRSMKGKKDMKGYTLTELLIALLVLIWLGGWFFIMGHFIIKFW